MELSTQQMQTAKQLHDNGASWSVIASYLKVNINKLRTMRKHYEQSTEQTEYS